MARQSYSAETTQVVTEGALQRELADDAIDSHSTHAQCAFLRTLRFRCGRAIRPLGAPALEMTPRMRASACTLSHA